MEKVPKFVWEWGPLLAFLTLPGDSPEFPLFAMNVVYDHAAGREGASKTLSAQVALLGFGAGMSVLLSRESWG